MKLVLHLFIYVSAGWAARQRQCHHSLALVFILLPTNRVSSTTGLSSIPVTPITCRGRATCQNIDSINVALKIMALFEWWVSRERDGKWCQDPILDAKKNQWLHMVPDFLLIQTKGSSQWLNQWCHPSHCIDWDSFTPGLLSGRQLL